MIVSIPLYPPPASLSLDQILRFHFNEHSGPLHSENRILLHSVPRSKQQKGLLAFVFENCQFKNSLPFFLNDKNKQCLSIIIGNHRLSSKSKASIIPPSGDVHSDAFQGPLWVLLMCSCATGGCCFLRLLLLRSPHQATLHPASPWPLPL